MSEKAIYWDTEKTVDARVADLLMRMTLREKLGQMLQMSGTDNDLHVRINDMKVGSLLHIQTETAAAAIAIASKTRLRIPLLLADDCIHGHGFAKGGTVFPTQLAMACSWDKERIERVGRVTAVEAVSTGLKWTFSPVLGVARDLRWGRVGETFGEDLFLASEFGAALIKGYQGEGLSDKTAILATAKHYAGYCETQGGRDASEADLSQRKLRSWFFPSFERAAQSGCMVFMTGYQAIDGVPSTACKWLLKEVLREEWGFRGIVVTDWDNVGRMFHEQQICSHMKDAARLAVKSGNDVMMATPSFIEGALAAIDDGSLLESEIDEVVARILALKFQMGLFEDPCSPNRERSELVLGCEEHRAANLELARCTPVLLQNNGILPLDGTSQLRIAVVGPNADDVDGQLGDWAGASGQAFWMKNGQPRDTVTTVLDGFRAISEEIENHTIEIVYEKGAELVSVDKEKYGYFNDGIFQRGDTGFQSANIESIDRAVSLVRGADVAVVVVGDNFVFAGEECSTATLEMQGGQIALLEQLSLLDTPLVVVLINTKPLVLPRCIHNAPAIIEAFNPGMEGGRAIAEIIIGKTNPCGKLPISIPYHVGQQPVYYNQVRGQHGDRYADMTQRPHFPFGFGLSYSQFRYRNLVVQTSVVKRHSSFGCAVDVENVSNVDGMEIVQLYIHDKITSVTWSGKELKGYKKVNIPAHATRTVEFLLPVDSFSIVSAQGERVVEPGEFTVMVGPSSASETLLKKSFLVV